MQKAMRVLIVGCFAGLSSGVKAGHAEKVSNRKGGFTKSRVSKSTVRAPGRRSTKRMTRKRYSNNSLVKDNSGKYRRRLKQDTKSVTILGKSGTRVRTTKMESRNQRRNLKSQKSSQELNSKLSKSKLNRASSSSKGRVSTNLSDDTKLNLMNDEAEMAGITSGTRKK